jgi:hypothetical protein
MKRGIYTSEFWAMLISWVCGFGVSMGWVKPEESGHLSEGLMFVVGLVLQGVPVVSYIVGRSWVKGKG